MRRLDRPGRVLFVAAMMMAGATAALATDLPTKIPVGAAPVFAPSWAGFYAGAHVGYGWSDPGAFVDPASLLPLFPGYNPATSTASAPFTLSVDPQGWLGGLQAGTNWQSGRLVYGIEADVSLAKIKDQATGSYTLHPVFLVGDFDNYIGSVTLKQEIDYLGTVRGRIGYGGESWLLYATGGLAWAHVKTSLDSHHTQLTNNIIIAGFPQALDGHAAASGIQWGYALGGGLEWAFAPQWSLKGEYLYIDLGGGTALSIPGTTFNDTGIALHTARLGVNYRFGR